jgi:hypothetical protein
VVHEGLLVDPPHALQRADIERIPGAATGPDARSRTRRGPPRFGLFPARSPAPPSDQAVLGALASSSLRRPHGIFSRSVANWPNCNNTTDLKSIGGRTHSRAPCKGPRLPSLAILDPYGALVSEKGCPNRAISAVIRNTTHKNKKPFIHKVSR